MSRSYHGTARAGLIALFLFASAAVWAAETNREALRELQNRFEAQWQARQGPVYRQILADPSNPMTLLHNQPDAEFIGIDPVTGRPLVYHVQNLNAARTLSTDNVWPGGGFGYSYSGSGIAAGELAVWDGGGVRTTHQEFQGRVTQMDNPGSTHYHATHVAGTMIAGGVNTSAKGMSHDAPLHAYDWTSDESEMASAAAGNLLTSNHSYGFITGWYYNSGAGMWYWYGDPDVSETEDYSFGYYSSGSADWDEIVYNAPYYVIVKSAGNDRNDVPENQPVQHYVWDGGWTLSSTVRDADGGVDGYDCIGARGVSKNVITVGAVYDITAGYSSPSDVVMSSFSGWGPTDDGRIKPDLVANGVSLTSTTDTGDSDYLTISGTSMSSPNLSGSVALVQEAWQATHTGAPLAATVKAILIQTADEAGSHEGPDYAFGWGLMNTLHAIDLVHDDASGDAQVEEADLASGETDEYLFSAPGGQDFRATISWTDPAAVPLTNNVLNNTTPRLVNDLDILLVNVDSPTTTYSPYILNVANPSAAATTGDNDVDNVEQIYVADLPAGNYRLEVSHEGTITDGPQDYSLAMQGMGESITLNPPQNLQADHDGTGEITLTWQAPATAGFLETFNGPSAWFARSDASAVENSHGRMILRPSRYSDFTAMRYSGRMYDDAIVEAEFGFTSPEDIAGVTVRGQGTLGKSYRGYWVAISAKGYWSVQRLEDGEAVDLTGWREHAAVHTGPGSFNTMSVTTRGDELHVYINDEHAGSVRDDRYARGYAGVAAGFGAGKGEVRCYYTAVSMDDELLRKTSNHEVTAAVNRRTAMRHAARCDLPMRHRPGKLSEGVIRARNVDPYTRLGDTPGGDELDEFESYNLYRNGTLLDNTTNTSYVDNLPGYGTYDYEVTAVYTEGESDPEGPMSVTWNAPVGDILLFEPDLVPTSGTEIQTVLEDLGYTVAYTTTLDGLTLDDYDMVFVCSGMYEAGSTYFWEDGGTEETMLINYLDADGNLYFEGGDVFGYSGVRPDNLLPYFNLTGIADGGSDLSTVEGVAGTFTESVQMTYDGVNSWVDHINPDTGAELIWNNPSDDQGCGVLYDEGGYRTVAVSFEAGMLLDGTFPSTREQFFHQVVDFFQNGSTEAESPDPFALTSPVDGTVLTEDLDVTLSWETTTDPEPGDAVTYSVYTSDVPNPGDPGTPEASGLTGSSHTITLEDDQTVYWSVKAVDGNTGGTWASSGWWAVSAAIPESPDDFH
ncbi:S8 family serine peptidase, partial [bacterium]|nr:S8 family serine peptidase [bacterium]